MLKFLVISLGCLLSPVAAIAGPDDVIPVEGYIDPVDQQIAATGVVIWEDPGPCERRKMAAWGAYYTRLPTDQCVKMLPTQRWRGIWRNQFEGQLFCTDPCVQKGDLIWLTDRTGNRDKQRDGIYRIEFEGRRTMYRGPYGHFGLADHEIIVDRMISIRRLKGR